MEPHDDTGAAPKNNALKNGLTVAGILILVVGGIALIIYGARYIPETLSRLAGAVYLSPSGGANEAPVATTTAAKPATTQATSSGPVYTTPTVPTGTTQTTVIRPTVTTVPARLYGLPDLSVQILSTGYLRTGSASSFVPASSISADDRPAIRFRVHNLGTNAVANWQVEIQYPVASGDDTYLITSRDLLYPGGYKDFNFGFDNPEEGNNREFVVTADPDNRLSETNENNDDDSATMDIGNGNNNNNSSSDISCDLSVSPSRINEGDHATLRWTTDGSVTDADINHGVGDVDNRSGNVRVSPDVDTTYRLTIVDRHDNEETCSVTLRVDN